MGASARDLLETIKISAGDAEKIRFILCHSSVVVALCDNDLFILARDDLMTALVLRTTILRMTK